MENRVETRKGEWKSGRVEGEESRREEESRRGEDSRREEVKQGRGEGEVKGEGKGQRDEREGGGEERETVE